MIQFEPSNFTWILWAALSGFCIGISIGVAITFFILRGWKNTLMLRPGPHLGGLAAGMTRSQMPTPGAAVPGRPEPTMRPQAYKESKKALAIITIKDVEVTEDCESIVDTFKTIPVGTYGTIEKFGDGGADVWFDGENDPVWLTNDQFGFYPHRKVIGN